MIGRDDGFAATRERGPWAFQRWALAMADERKLTPLEAHVLTVLSVYVDQHGETFVGLDALARDVRRGRRQVTGALGSLGRSGLLERRGRGPGRTPVTRLLAPDLTRGLPLPSDSRGAATQASDSRGASTHDSRVAAPLTRGEPLPEVPLEPPLSTPPPFPPRGEDRPTDLFAPPPKTDGRRQGRKRDHDDWERLVAAFAAEHYPAADWPLRESPARAVEKAIRGGASTEAELHERIERGWIRAARQVASP